MSPSPESLARVQLLRSFGAAELLQLSQRLRGHSFEPGASFRGEPGERNLWLLLDGRAAAVHHAGADLGALGPGSLIGHVELVLGIDEATEVTAITPCSCARMSEAAFAEWTASGDALALKFYRLLARCMVRQLRVANGRLARLVDQPGMQDLARARGLLPAEGPATPQ